VPYALRGINAARTGLLRDCLSFLAFVAVCGIVVFTRQIAARPPRASFFICSDLLFSKFIPFIHFISCVVVNA
jgi:hypothetical protein